MQVRQLEKPLHAIASQSRKSRVTPGCETVEVSTVDGFQGREKEVLVISTVRSNAAGRLGVLRDYRRLNVAFTRARRGMVVVGNAETLAASRLWNAWLLWVRGGGAVTRELAADKL